MTSNELTMPSKAVILVDDEKDVVSVFKRYLEISGYEVFSFTDPLLALEHFKLNKSGYGLIISDIRMPKMTGLELASKIRELDRSIPIVLMSAFEKASTDISPSLNISSFLQKPVSTSTLGVIVGKYVEVTAS